VSSRQFQQKGEPVRKNTTPEGPTDRRQWIQSRHLASLSTENMSPALTTGELCEDVTLRGIVGRAAGYHWYG